MRKPTFMSREETNKILKGYTREGLVKLLGESKYIDWFLVICQKGMTPRFFEWWKKAVMNHYEETKELEAIKKGKV